LNLGMGAGKSAPATHEQELRASVIAALIFVHGAVGAACERQRQQRHQQLFVTPR